METDTLYPQTLDLNGKALFEKIHTDFIGLDTEYTLANGKTTRRIYLDSTASTLMMGVAQRTALEFLRHYANTHSEMHFSAKIATKTYNQPSLFFLAPIIGMSCSSSISPTTSSIISSNVTIPISVPYSSTTNDKCLCLFLNSCN